MLAAVQEGIREEVFLQIHLVTLADVAQWIERCPVNQRAASLTPSRGTSLGCWPGPQ